MTIHLNLLLVCLETILLAWAVHYVTCRLLGGSLRFSLLLSVFVAGGWALFSLFGFLYINLRVLMGSQVFGGWQWLVYTGILFLVLFLSERFIFFLPWRLSAVAAVSLSAIWLLGLCVGKALGAFD